MKHQRGDRAILIQRKVADRGIILQWYSLDSLNAGREGFDELSLNR